MDTINHINGYARYSSWNTKEIREDLTMKSLTILYLPFFSLLVISLIISNISVHAESDRTTFLGYYEWQLNRLYAKKGGAEMLIASNTTMVHTYQDSLPHLHPSDESGVKSASGEAFKLVNGDRYLTTVIFKMHKTGSPTGNDAKAALYATTGDFGSTAKPSGDALAVSDNFDISTLTGSDVDVSFTFSGNNSYRLLNNTVYAITFLCPTSGFMNSTNRITFYKGDTETYNGNYFCYKNGVWVTTVYEGSDLYFKLYGNSVVSLIPMSWAASDGQDTMNDLRFELTLCVFAEAYKITGNQTYLNWSKQAFDEGLEYCFEPKTNLFATRFNRFLGKYKSDLGVLWGGVLLNALFDFADTTKNATHLAYAETYGDALYKYAINKTSWLPYAKINVTNGNVLDYDFDVCMESGRLIGGYIRGYEVTENYTYVEIAENLTRGFWDKRNSTTNLWGTGGNSHTGVMLDFNHPDFDPIQNVLLYAYDRTKNTYFLNVARLSTDVQLEYGWFNNRLARSIYTNGDLRDTTLYLVHGASLYVGALAQLYYITKDATYLNYAKTYWNTLYTKAKVNGLYVTDLDENNNPNDKSSMWCMQMAIQSDALLYHVCHNATYINDLISTVNAFWDKYRYTYGFTNEINATTFEVISDRTVDWLDSSSYILGSSISCLEWYPNNNEVIGDMFYYVPYYPMFKGSSIQVIYRDSGNGYSGGSSTIDFRELSDALIAFAMLVICVKLVRR